MGASQIDASQIIPGLYQGGMPPEGELLRRSGVTMLVLAAMEHQPPSRRFPGVVVLSAPLEDHTDPLTDDEVQLIRLAGQMAAREVIRGGVVLVTCHMGINRSGIITAAALCVMGLTPRQAVWQIRRQRSGALQNQSFVRQLIMVAGPARAGRYELIDR